MTWNRIFHFFLLAAFFAIAVVGGISLVRDYREYRQVKTVEEVTSRRLRDIERHLAEQERISQRLVSDRAYVELMIRRRLNYAKPEEKVFRFDE